MFIPMHSLSRQTRRHNLHFSFFIYYFEYKRNVSLIRGGQAARHFLRTVSPPKALLQCKAPGSKLSLTIHHKIKTRNHLVYNYQSNQTKKQKALITEAYDLIRRRKNAWDI